jgi:hypothetical protein
MVERQTKMAERKRKVTEEEINDRAGEEKHGREGKAKMTMKRSENGRREEKKVERERKKKNGKIAKRRAKVAERERK